MPETAAGGGFPFESSLIYYNGTIKNLGSIIIGHTRKKIKTRTVMRGNSVMADNQLCRDFRHYIYPDPLEAVWPVSVNIIRRRE